MRRDCVSSPMPPWACLRRQEIIELPNTTLKAPLRASASALVQIYSFSLFSGQICNLASYCLCSCSTDAACTGTESDAVMVYVWGSNSSHQLAEGTLEKILLPKLTQGFSDAQMVQLQDTINIMRIFFLPAYFTSPHLSVLLPRLRRDSTAPSLCRQMVLWKLVGKAAMAALAWETLTTSPCPKSLCWSLTGTWRRCRPQRALTDTLWQLLWRGR